MGPTECRKRNTKSWIIYLTPGTPPRFERGVGPPTPGACRFDPHPPPPRLKKISVTSWPLGVIPHQPADPQQGNTTHPIKRKHDQHFFTHNERARTSTATSHMGKLIESFLFKPIKLFANKIICDVNQCSVSWTEPRFNFLGKPRKLFSKIMAPHPAPTLPPGPTASWEPVFPGSLPPPLPAHHHALFFL